MPANPDIAWNRVSAFVRQHTHDLRNTLNGLDLEAALLLDSVPAGEAQEGVRRIRAQVRKMAADLRVLAAKFAEARPNPMRLPARELFAIWQEQVRDLPQLDVAWEHRLADESVNVDPESFAAGLRELLVNADAFAPEVRAQIRAGSWANGAVIFELREPKRDAVDPRGWGTTPLVSTRRGGYGLGLFVFTQTLEAHASKVAWRFDPEARELITTISIPIAAAE